MLCLLQHCLVARYVNDASEKYSKRVMKIMKIMVNSIPKRALVAKQYIRPNIELRCSYCLVLFQG